MSLVKYSGPSNRKFSSSSLIHQAQEDATDLFQALVDKPSVGMHFIQRHVHRSVPNLISLKNTIVKETRSSVLEMEDVKAKSDEIRRLKVIGPAIISNILSTLESSSSLISSLESKYYNKPKSRSGRIFQSTEPNPQNIPTHVKQFGLENSSPSQSQTFQAQPEPSESSLNVSKIATSSNEESSSENELENLTSFEKNEADLWSGPKQKISNRFFENGIENVKRLSFESIKLIEKMKGNIANERNLKDMAVHSVTSEPVNFNWKTFSNSLVAQIKKIDNVLPPLKPHEYGKETKNDKSKGNNQSFKHLSPQNESNVGDENLNDGRMHGVKREVDDFKVDIKSERRKEAIAESELFSTFESEKQMNLEDWLGN